MHSVIAIPNLTDCNTFISKFTGKEGMRTEDFYYELGATAACTVRLGVGTNSLPESRSIIMADAWFGSVRAAAATAERVIEDIYQVKINHGLYP